MAINYNQVTGYESENRKSRSLNINDVRRNMRETLCKTRQYSRSRQIIQNRKSLQESIRTQDILNNDDPELDVDESSDLRSNGRSPSPASSLASFDSTYAAFQQTDELPQYMFEASHHQGLSPRKNKSNKRLQRNSLYKSHQKFDHRRVPIDHSRLIQEFQAFFQFLYSNRNCRDSIRDLIAYDWQVLFNALKTDDPIIFEKCLNIFILLMDGNLIPAHICMEMLRNGLTSLLKRKIWVQGTNNSKLICKLLTTLHKSQPTCTPLLFEMLVSTQILKSFIDATLEEISYDIYDYLLFFHFILQTLVEDLPTIDAAGQLPNVPQLWTKLIDQSIISTMIKNFLDTPIYKLRDDESVRLVLTILANILKISHANVDATWAVTILKSFPTAHIEYSLSSQIEYGSDVNDLPGESQRILKHYHEFLLFYNQHYPNLCHIYNLCPRVDTKSLEIW